MPLAKPPLPTAYLQWVKRVMVFLLAHSVFRIVRTLPHILLLWCAVLQLDHTVVAPVASSSNVSLPGWHRQGWEKDSKTPSMPLERDPSIHSNYMPGLKRKKRSAGGLDKLLWWRGGEVGQAGEEGVRGWVATNIWEQSPSGG